MFWRTRHLLLLLLRELGDVIRRKGRKNLQRGLGQTLEDLGVQAETGFPLTAGELGRACKAWLHQRTWKKGSGLGGRRDWVGRWETGHGQARGGSLSSEESPHNSRDVASSREEGRCGAASHDQFWAFTCGCSSLCLECLLPLFLLIFLGLSLKDTSEEPSLTLEGAFLG